MTDALVPADENRHVAGAEHSGWEAFTLDFVAADATIAGAIGLVLHSGSGSCAFWASLCGPGRQYLTIVESDLAMPRDLELRAPGLWVEVQVLVPWDHVTVGLEAFAVGLDDPADALGKLWGDRVPFGLDLEWDTGAPDDVVRAGCGGAVGYEMPCVVHGEVLVADERIELDGFGSRSHHWGATHPWVEPRARQVVAGSILGAPPDDARIEPLAEAPLMIDLGAATPLRMDRTLGVVHDAVMPSDRPGRLTWIERNHPC